MNAGGGIIAIKSMRRLIILLLAVGLATSFAADTRSRKRANASADKPGQFDYYLLSLSWSPEYCAGPNGGRDRQQCGEQRRFGFVVHGLWPQYERGYPDACGSPSQVPQSIVSAMLPLMPSPRLIQHEWEKHGTCSGLDVNGYFKLIQTAFANVQVPADFKSPIKQVEVAPAAIRDKFAKANAGIPAPGIKVLCGGGRYLSEVRICLTKDLKGRACSSEVRDTCRADTVIMRPLR